MAALLGFNLAYISSQFWPSLPAPLLMVGIIMAALTVTRNALLVVNTQMYWLLLGTLFGVLWGASVGHWHQSWQLSGMKFQQDVIILGQITEVKAKPYGMKLQVNLKKLDQSRFWVERKISLYSYDNQLKLHSGDSIFTSVRLKPTHAIANPHTFDGERAIVARNVIATGSISTRQIPIVFPRTQTSIRQTIESAIGALKLTNEHWLLALAIAQRDGISAQEWQLLQHSGVAHLFAISGLHLGIVAGFVLLLLRFFVRVLGYFSAFFVIESGWFEINLNPLIYIALVASCAGYAYLANWQIPVMRAWLAVSVVVLIATMRWQLSFLTLFLIVLTTIFVAHPYSAYSNSLWLSLFAVLFIGAFFKRYNFSTATLSQKCVAFIAMQLWLSLLLTPVSLGFIGTYSWIGVLINLFAVPLVTFVIVPAILVAVLFILIGSHLYCPILYGLDIVIGTLFKAIITLIEASAAGYGTLSLPVGILLSIGLLIAIGLLPRFDHKWKVMALWLFPWGLYQYDQRAIGTDPMWHLHIYDVGQGSAAAITRGRSGIIFDTGASASNGFSFAKTVIVPFIRAKGISRIDAIFISHHDNDHAGGLRHMQEQFPDAQVFSPPRCQRGDVYHWQGLTIETLWPKSNASVNLNRNNLSCVIKVSDGQHSVLFAGDIEDTAEWQLVKEERMRLASDILVAPHHGSNTSSTWALLGAVKPIHTVISAGFLNRWKFPHDDVIQRLAFFESQIWQTAHHGYIRFSIPFVISEQLDSAIDPIQISSYRTDISPRWYREFD